MIFAFNIGASFADGAVRSSLAVRRIPRQLMMFDDESLVRLPHHNPTLTLTNVLNNERLLVVYVYSFILKTSQFVSKTRDFAFKMMDFAAGACTGGE